MSVRSIHLGNGRVMQIDEADVALIGSLNINVFVTKNGTSYATLRGGKHKVLVHRLILGAPKGVFVDHIDGNGLNNARNNLRLCSQAENAQNRHKKALGISKFKGVVRRSHGWEAVISGSAVKARFLGTFKTEDDAARAYDTAAKQFYGPFACLNFPNDHQHQLPSPSSLAKDFSQCLPDRGKSFP